MSQQPSLLSQRAPSSTPPPDPVAEAPHSGYQPGKVPPWLQYLELSVRVIVRLYLGLILVVLPWTHFWNDNRLLLFIPHLPSLALNGITRGIVSGLGLLNIWIAIDDAIHFKQT